MSDEKATVGTFHRCPAAHLRGRTGLVQIDGGLATEAVGTCIFRPVFFMRSPAEFGRLEQLADEAIDGPGVDEFVAFLANGGVLRVAFSDVNDADIEPARQIRPFFTGGRSGVDAIVFGDVQKRLFQKTGDQSGIRALADDGGRTTRMLASEIQSCFAQGIVGTVGSGSAGIGVAAFPRFDRGIDVERFFFVTECHQSQTERRIRKD